jgi:hypothetical protein
MKLLPLAAVAGALALGGCSSLQSLWDGPGTAQAAPGALMDAEKALTVAHLAYQAIGVSLEQAAQSGALAGDDAANARALFDKAGTALDIADAADEAANAEGVFAAVADAEAAISSINAIIRT